MTALTKGLGFTISKCIAGQTRTNGRLLQRRYGSAYEGDGKTSVTILNQESDHGLMINSYSQAGFRLNNEMMVIGPMAIFPRCALSWNVAGFEDISETNLSLFCALEPKLDVLVIGIGNQVVTPKISRTIIDFMRKFRINVEVLNTEQACATFNFLNAENRMVGAAMIPPNHIAMSESSVLFNKDFNQRVFKAIE